MAFPYPNTGKPTTACACNGGCPRCGVWGDLVDTTAAVVVGSAPQLFDTGTLAALAAAVVEWLRDDPVADKIEERPERCPVPTGPIAPARPRRPRPDRPGCPGERGETWPHWARPPPRTPRPSGRVAPKILSMSEGLNPKQQKFVERYLATGNATQSYIDAGYKARGNAAETGAARMLRNAQVKKALEAASAKGAERAAVTAAWVMKNMKREATYRGRGASHMARVRATELLGRPFNLFPEKQQHEHTGKDGEPIEHDHRVTTRIDQLTDTFLAAARREEGGAVPGDGR
jgi:phage terminase small subunit